jgi:hypothetical protein
MDGEIFLVLRRWRRRKVKILEWRLTFFAFCFFLLFNIDCRALSPSKS